MLSEFFIRKFYFPLPTCAADCSTALPSVSFNDCSPDVSFSEIQRAFFGTVDGGGFDDWTQASEWTSKISSTSTTAGSLRAMTVIGDKPAASSVTKDISGGRKLTIGKDFTVNLTIDDVSEANYNFWRQMECGNKLLFWYETSGGKMFGDNEGIEVNVDSNSVLNRGREEIETIELVVSWRAKFSPARIDSPIFGSGSESAPTTFDTLISFSSSANPPTVEGVHATNSAIDADAKFEFNKVVDQTGAPATMTIYVGGVNVCSVSFPNNYLGVWFKYTDASAVAHTSQFKDGTVSFT